MLVCLLLLSFGAIHERKIDVIRWSHTVCMAICVLHMPEIQHLLPDPGGRLPNGSLYADPLRFPNGLSALSASVSRFGVRLGAYTARGRLTCMGRAGDDDDATL